MEKNNSDRICLENINNLSPLKIQIDKDCSLHAIFDYTDADDPVTFSLRSFNSKQEFCQLKLSSKELLECVEKMQVSLKELLLLDDGFFSIINQNDTNQLRMTYHLAKNGDVGIDIRNFIRMPGQDSYKATSHGVRLYSGVDAAKALMAAKSQIKYRIKLAADLSGFIFSLAERLYLIYNKYPKEVNPNDSWFERRKKLKSNVVDFLLCELENKTISNGLFSQVCIETKTHYQYYSRSLIDGSTPVPFMRLLCEKIMQFAE